MEDSGRPGAYALRDFLPAAWFCNSIIRKKFTGQGKRFLVLISGCHLSVQRVPTAKNCAVGAVDRLRQDTPSDWYRARALSPNLILLLGLSPTRTCPCGRSSAHTPSIPPPRQRLLGNGLAGILTTMKEV